MSPKFLTYRQISELTGLSRVTLHRMVKRGDFPAPAYLSPKIPRWHRDVFDAWVARVSEGEKQHAT